MKRLISAILLCTGFHLMAAEPVPLDSCSVANITQFNQEKCYVQIEEAILKQAEGTVQGQLIPLQQKFLKDQGFKPATRAVYLKSKKRSVDMEVEDTYLKLSVEERITLGTFHLRDGEVMLEVSYARLDDLSGMYINHLVNVFIKAEYTIFQNDTDPPSSQKYLFRIRSVKIVEPAGGPRSQGNSSGGGGRK